MAHKCTYCDLMFTKRVNLNQHILVHTGQKRHKCNYCEKTFTQKSTMNRHMMIHTGVKPYKCDYCDKQFSRKDYLHKHLSVHKPKVQQGGHHDKYNNHEGGGSTAQVVVTTSPGSVINQSGSGNGSTIIESPYSGSSPNHPGLAEWILERNNVIVTRQLLLGTSSDISGNEVPLQLSTNDYNTLYKTTLYKTDAGAALKLEPEDDNNTAANDMQQQQQDQQEHDYVKSEPLAELSQESSPNNECI